MLSCPECALAWYVCLLFFGGGKGLCCASHHISKISCKKKILSDCNFRTVSCNSLHNFNTYNCSLFTEYIKHTTNVHGVLVVKSICLSLYIYTYRNIYKYILTHTFMHQIQSSLQTEILLSGLWCIKIGRRRYHLKKMEKDKKNKKKGKFKKKSKCSSCTLMWPVLVFHKVFHFKAFKKKKSISFTICRNSKCQNQCNCYFSYLY